MIKQYTPYVPGESISENMGKITVYGHIGTWYVVERIVHNGRNVFLLEHKEYGDEADNIVVDISGNVICDEVQGDWPGCLDY